jgi:hypothetical protein
VVEDIYGDYFEAIDRAEKGLLALEQAQKRGRARQYLGSRDSPGELSGDDNPETVTVFVTEQEDGTILIRIRVGREDELLEDLVEVARPDKETLERPYDFWASLGDGAYEIPIGDQADEAAPLDPARVLRVDLQNVGWDLEPDGSIKPSAGFLEPSPPDPALVARLNNYRAWLAQEALNPDGLPILIVFVSQEAPDQLLLRMRAKDEAEGEGEGEDEGEDHMLGEFLQVLEPGQEFLLRPYEAWQSLGPGRHEIPLRPPTDKGRRR